MVHKISRYTRGDGLVVHNCFLSILIEVRLGTAIQYVRTRTSTDSVQARQNDLVFIYNYIQNAAVILVFTPFKI